MTRATDIAPGTIESTGSSDRPFRPWLRRIADGSSPRAAAKSRTCAELRRLSPRLNSSGGGRSCLECSRARAKFSEPGTPPSLRRSSDLLPHEAGVWVGAGSGFALLGLRVAARTGHQASVNDREGL